MIAINHNLMAANTANELTSHYGRLQTSTQRLSSGLRINSAADDAAGLAIREIMRADVAALNQGIRNANDAISMLQTFDGALGIIDEKLIRMKELAEQAATGTYDSTQRLMIDSEFQTMGSEINRIANATDFNGVKLLCTPMVTKYRDVEKLEITNSGSLDNLVPTTGAAATLTDLDPEKYINKDNPVRTISVNLTAQNGTRVASGNLGAPEPSPIPGGTQYKLGDTEFSLAYVYQLGNASDPVISYTAGAGWTIADDNFASYRPQTINPGDQSIIGTVSAIQGGPAQIEFLLNHVDSGLVDFSTFAADYSDIASLEVNTSTGKYSITRNVVTLNPADNDGIYRTADYTAIYDEKNQAITVNFTNGGKATVKLDAPLTAGDSVSFDLNIEGEVKTVQEPYKVPDPDQKVKIHFGTMNDSAEDYYYIDFENCTLEGLGLDGVNVKTQDNAQNALVDIDGAIVQKDKVRAKYGTMQNRLENTVANLRIQAENLQTAESRISDADIALEMTQFVRNQILTQSAVAMLAQANSMPQLVMRLVG